MNLHLFSAILVYQLKAFYNTCHIHTHIRTLIGEAVMQGVNLLIRGDTASSIQIEQYFYIQQFTETLKLLDRTAIRSNLGFSI